MRRVNMDKQLIEKIQGDYKQGKGIENTFIEVTQREQFYHILPTSKEDATEHWDIRLVKNPFSMYLDIKSEKEATKRYDCTWLELVNVKGNDGWLYAPKLEGVAFLRRGVFNIVPIEPLREIIEEKATDKFVYVKPDDYYSELLYNRYVRRGDIMVLVPFSDILPHTIMTFKI